MRQKIVVLAGGVGAARFLKSILQIIPEEDVTVIVNTGDDMRFYGLYVSPDIDTITYTLKGLVDPKNGWGIKNDTFHTMSQLTELSQESWFLLGDSDLATHILRTKILSQGHSLSYATNKIINLFGLKIKILPMTDDPTPTLINTKNGWIHFQEYLVKYKTQIQALDIRFDAISDSKPAPGVLKEISQASAIIIAPSNPLVSIAPILSVPGVKNAIQKNPSVKIAISPLVKGKPIKGPLDKLMRGKKMEVSSVAIASYYRDIINNFVIDSSDSHLIPEISAMGIKTTHIDTIMDTRLKRGKLAKLVLRLCASK